MDEGFLSPALAGGGIFSGMTAALGLAPLWSRAREIWSEIACLFGEPRALYRGHPRHEIDRRLMPPYLRALEALLRRLMLTEALALAQSLILPALRLRRRAPKAAPRDPDAPVAPAFRVFLAARRPDPARARNRAPIPRSMRGLALRLAAAARALLEPEAHVLRLARRLVRRRTDDPASRLRPYRTPAGKLRPGDCAAAEALDKLAPLLAPALAAWRGSG